MGYFLDYSAGKLTGATVSNSGYTGAIRYIDSPANLKAKHTSLSEYNSLRAAGLPVYLVFENSTTDADGGYSSGVANAQRALAGANYLGYSGPIFFCNDRPTSPNAAAWRGYLDGAASVLGFGRVGAYGFYNAMDQAVGHATYFWQAGRRADVRSFVHFWQDNNVQVTVGGISCDRNLPLIAMSTGGGTAPVAPTKKEDLMFVELPACGQNPDGSYKTNGVSVPLPGVRAALTLIPGRDSSGTVVQAWLAGIDCYTDYGQGFIGRLRQYSTDNNPVQPVPTIRKWVLESVSGAAYQDALEGYITYSSSVPLKISVQAL